jgi:cell division protein FtsB
MKWLAAALLLALILLQYRLWVSNDGMREALRLQNAVAVQEAENARLSERNRQLAAEVRDLKQGYAALEERARSELGMIAGNETFYQVVPPKSALAPAPTLPAAPASTASASRTAAAR